MTFIVKTSLNCKYGVPVNRTGKNLHSFCSFVSYIKVDETDFKHFLNFMTKHKMRLYCTQTFYLIYFVTLEVSKSFFTLER